MRNKITKKMIELTIGVAVAVALAVIAASAVWAAIKAVTTKDE
jgi:hypothetical protein